jgi:hypothetical protein
MVIANNSSLMRESEELSSELINMFNYFDTYRAPYDDIAIGNYKIYRGYKDKTEEEKTDEEEGEQLKSNLHIPRTYEIVDTIRSRIVLSFFSRRPYIEFNPKPSLLDINNLAMAEMKAKIASGLVDDQLEKNDIVTKYYDYVTSFLIFPAGYLGVGWKYEEDMVKKKIPVPEVIRTSYGTQWTGNTTYNVQESKEVIWDDNEIINYDYFDVWPDPKGNDVRNFRGVFIREFITYEELMQELNYLHYLDEGVIYPVDFEEIREAGLALDLGREERMAEVGLSTGGVDMFSQANDNKLRNNTLFEKLTYWEKKRRAIILNRTKVVYDGPSPYWRHREIPIVASVFDRNPNEFFGLSAVQIIHDLQHEENTIHNQRSDNVNLIINKIFKIKRGADIDKSQLVSRPGGYIEVDDMQDIDELDMRDVAASSFQQQNIVAGIMENVLAAPPVMRGADSSGTKTATETMKQTSNAGLRFDVKIQLYKNTGIKRLIHLMDMNNQQFINDARLIKLGTSDAIEWKLAEPSQWIGEYDYDPASSNNDPAANKIIRREQLTAMMQFLLQAGIPFINYQLLVKEWLETFDITNPLKFFIPPEIGMQQLTMWGGGGGSEGPMPPSNQPTMAEQTANGYYGKRSYGSPEDRIQQERPSGNVR